MASVQQALNKTYREIFPLRLFVIFLLLFLRITCPCTLKKGRLITRDPNINSEFEVKYYPRETSCSQICHLFCFYLMLKENETIKQSIYLIFLMIQNTKLYQNVSSKAATQDWSLKPKVNKVLIKILNRNGNKGKRQKERKCCSPHLSILRHTLSLRDWRAWGKGKNLTPYWARSKKKKLPIADSVSWSHI